MLLEGVLPSSGGRQSGFRGLRRPRLNPNYAHEMFLERHTAEWRDAYRELRERSLPQRGIQLSLDVVVF